MRDKLLGNLLVNGYNYITKVNIKKKPIANKETNKNFSNPKEQWKW